jgi:hypothetical protein
LETLWYMPCTEVPMVMTTAIMAAAMPEAISAYSMAVAPPSSRTKSR